MATALFAKFRSAFFQYRGASRLQRHPCIYQHWTHRTPCSPSGLRRSKPPREVIRATLASVRTRRDVARAPRCRATAFRFGNCGRSRRRHKTDHPDSHQHTIGLTLRPPLISKRPILHDTLTIRAVVLFMSAVSQLMERALRSSTDSRVQPSTSPAVQRLQVKQPTSSSPAIVDFDKFLPAVMATTPYRYLAGGYDRM